MAQYRADGRPCIPLPSVQGLSREIDVGRGGEERRVEGPGHLLGRDAKADGGITDIIRRTLPVWRARHFHALRHVLLHPRLLSPSNRSRERETVLTFQSEEGLATIRQMIEIKSQIRHGNLQSVLARSALV